LIFVISLLYEPRVRRLITAKIHGRFKVRSSVRSCQLSCRLLLPTADCRPADQPTNLPNAFTLSSKKAVLDHVEEDNEGTADPQLATNLDGIDSDDNNLYDV
jgi:hypothetical protein